MIHGAIVIEDVAFAWRVMSVIPVKYTIPTGANEVSGESLNSEVPNLSLIHI